MPAAPDPDTFTTNASRCRLVVLWVVLASAPFCLSFALPASAPAHLRWVVMGVGGALSLALVVIGIPRCLRVSVKVSEAGVTYQNMFGSGSYPWGDLAEVTLRRYLSVSSADEQRLTQTARGLNGLAPPAIALRTNSGQLTKPITATLILSFAEKQRFVRALNWRAPKGVDVRVIDPTPGFFSALTWDIRVGKGMTEKRVEQ